MGLTFLESFFLLFLPWSLLSAAQFQIGLDQSKCPTTEPISFVDSCSPVGTLLNDEKHKRANTTSATIPTTRKRLDAVVFQRFICLFQAQLTSGFVLMAAAVSFRVTTRVSRKPTRN
jgi:hypothetical protein